MWTGLLLLCAQFALGMTSNAAICSECLCLVRYLRANTYSVTVNCQGHADINDDQLSEQLESQLSTNLTYGHLSSVSIINSPLTRFPRSVCRLTTLTHLQLDNNRLTRLPDNCLTKLSNLVRFTAADNAIETLQDGVFSGMTRLQYLDLSRNRISSIGLSVFTTSANLSNLYTILLSGNNLTSVEPWIIERGLIGSFQKIVHIDLSSNRISKFTNNMGHKETCHKIPFAYINLDYNNIRHFIDILIGWKVDFEVALHCFHVIGGRINLMFSYTGNRIACDCIDYNFFRQPLLQKIEYHDQPTLCMLTDPLTKKANLVDGFRTPLSLFVCELTELCPARCVCVHRPANFTLHVYCSNTNLTVLPHELPELPDSRTKYKLDFSNNQLHRLEHRDYFVNASILDVSHSGVVSVINWEEIAKIPHVNLFSNKIASLPRSILSVNITTEKLNLANNQWDCSCDSKWMSDWLASIADRLTLDVLCYSPDRLRGKKIIQIDNEEFCVDPASEAASRVAKRSLTTSLSSVAGVLLVLLTVGAVVYRLRVRLFASWKFHPFDRDECLGEDMDFDVFLSCCTDDNLPHGNEIREQLERFGYRICYPPRDFVAGDTI